MAGIEYGPFAGEFRGLDPHYTPKNASVAARDCVVGRGGLRPLRAPATVRSLDTTGVQVKQLFRYTDSIWFEFADDVDVVRAPIANDGYDRVYWTGQGIPEFTTNAVATASPPYPTTSYELGIRIPGAACTATPSGTPDDPDDLPVSSYYVYTYVDQHGAEGAPSPISNEVEVRPGESVTLTGFVLAAAGAYVYTNMRIYRANTGSAGSVFQFVGEKGYDVSQFIDTVSDDLLGEAIRTTEYDQPEATMQGLTVVSDGFLAGFFDNVLCFSEPGAPHAWPVTYQRPLEHAIVGIASFRNSILVATDGQPYIFSGIDPASMARSKLEIEQPCVSKQSIVALEGGAAYASPDGLVLVTEQGSQNITEGNKLFDRDAWQAIKPESIRAVRWESRYLASYDTGTEQGMFWIDLRYPGEYGVVFSQQFEPYLTADVARDEIYAATANSVTQWDAGAEYSYVWRSRPTTLKRPINFAAAKVHAEEFNTGNFEFIADGASKHSQAVTSNALIRLPAGYRAYDVQIELTGTNRVHTVEVATSAATGSQLGEA